MSGVCGREVSSSAGEGASKGRHLLDLLFVKREGLVGDGGHLGHRDHKFLEQ